VIDGERWCFMEVTPSMGEVAAVHEDRTSVAELWAPEACGGRAMHLDRPAERLGVSFASGSLSIRVADPELGAWVRDLPAHADVEAAVHVFVASSTRRRPDDAVRYRLFNGFGQLVAAPVGLDAAKRAVAAMVVGRLGHQDPRPGSALVVGRWLSKDDHTMLATPSSFDGGSHTLHHLSREGVQVGPTTGVVLAPDGRHLLVIDADAALDAVVTGRLDDPWDDILWKERLLDRVLLSPGTPHRGPADRAVDVLGATPGHDHPSQRTELLAAVGRLMEAVPVAELVTLESSPLFTARQIAALLS
jgi:hypothetical protein